MLLFSTILSINKQMTKNDFIKLVIEWNQGSPHQTNVIPDIVWNGERNIRFGDENLWLDIEEYRNQNIIAVRFEKRETDGVIWDTDYVMNFSERKMAIRLDRSYTADALIDNPKFSTPHFISMLIERGYVEDDDDLPVLRTPYQIDENNLDLIADVILKKKHYQLPIVYVSRTYYDHDPVDIGILAARLKGVAHVLTQESIITNYKLRDMCHRANEYYGAIGIYFPNASNNHRKFFYRSAIGYDTFLLENVIQLVIQYSNTQVMDTMYTWQGVNNAILRDRLISQREERIAAEDARKRAENDAQYLLESLNEEERRIRKKAFEDAKFEADTLIEGFDEDMQRLQKQIDELTRANEALQYENQGLKNKLDSTSDLPVLYMGDEYEFYQGEVKDLLLAVLSDALNNLQPKSRRMDIVRDIIQRNKYQKISEKRAEEIKRMLNNYDGMSSRLRQNLEEFGFKITEEGKHYKLSYYGDGRYCLTCAKTPSDTRSGKNNALQIIRSML